MTAAQGTLTLAPIQDIPHLVTSRCTAMVRGVEAVSAFGPLLLENGLSPRGGMPVALRA